MRRAGSSPTGGCRCGTRPAKPLKVCWPVGGVKALLQGSGFAVSTRNATFPIHDRSHLTSLEKKLTAADKAESDQFGYSVSVAGDVATWPARHLASPAEWGIAARRMCSSGTRAARTRGPGGQTHGRRTKRRATSSVIHERGGRCGAGRGAGSVPGTRRTRARRTYLSAMRWHERVGPGGQAHGGGQGGGRRFGDSVSVAGDVALVGASMLLPVG